MPSYLIWKVKSLLGMKAPSNDFRDAFIPNRESEIPIKYEGIDEGVNITVGIDFIRTSPDHGTAFDIAGKNLASPKSFIKAINTIFSIKK